MTASGKNSSTEAILAVLSSPEITAEEIMGVNEKMMDGVLHYQAYAKVNGLDFFGSWTQKKYKAIREREYFVGLRLPRLTKNRYTSGDSDIYMGIAILTYINEKHSYKSNTKKSYLKTYKAWEKFHTVLVNELPEKLKSIKKHLQKMKKQQTAIILISVLKCSIKHMQERHGLVLTFDLKLFEKDLYDCIKAIPLSSNKPLTLSKKELNDFFSTLERACSGEINLQYTSQKSEFSNEVLEETLDLCKIEVSIGDRIGETLALTPDDINFDQQEISITKTWTEEGIQPLPKTSASHRVIPIPNSIVGTLKKRCEKVAKKEPILSNGTKYNLLFTFHRAVYENVFSSIRNLLGLKKGLTLYKLKHTFGTFFVERYSNDPRSIFFCAYIMGHNAKKNDRYEIATTKYVDNGNAWKKMLTVFNIFEYAKSPDIDQDTFVSDLNQRGFTGTEIFEMLKVVKDNFGVIMNDIDVYLQRLSIQDIVFFYTKMATHKPESSTETAA